MPVRPGGPEINGISVTVEQWSPRFPRMINAVEFVRLTDSQGNLISFLAVGSNENLFLFNEDDLGKEVDPIVPLKRSMADGLGSSILTSLEQLGNELWIGTPRGLGRLPSLDQDIITYNVTNSALPGDEIRDIAANERGTLLVATDNGLAYLKVTRDGDVNILTDLHPALEDLEIEKVASDDADGFWYAHGLGVGHLVLQGMTFVVQDYPYSGAKEIPLPNQDEAVGGVVGDILADGTERLWIADWNQGLGYLHISGDGPQFSFFANSSTGPEGTPNGIPLSLARDGDLLWIGTNVGLSRVEATALDPSTYRFQHFDLGEAVTTLVPDASGALVFGGVERWPHAGGLRYFLPTETGYSLIKYETSQDMQDPYVAALALDHEGSLWIGTRSGAISQMTFSESETNFVNHTIPPASSPYRTAHLHDLAIAADRTVWLASASGSYWLDPGNINPEVTAYAGPSSESSSFVLEPTADGPIWIGSSDGLEYMTDPYLLPGASCLLSDPSCSADSRGTGTFFSSLDGLPSGAVITLADGGDLLWMAIRGKGLIKVLKNAVTTLQRNEIQRLIYQQATTENSNLPSNHIVQLEIDRFGHLWVATLNGIALLKPNQQDLSQGSSSGPFVVLPASDHLWPGWINTIAADDDGGVWLGTGNQMVSGGLTHLSFPQGYADAPVSTIYTTQDGLASDRVLELAYDKLNHQIFFGTDVGVGRLKVP